MRNLRYAALLAAVGLVAAGCGDESGGSPATSPSAGTPSTTTSAPSTPPPGTPPPSTPPAGVLPVTVTRTGGFAGFDDRVVVGADGVASVSKRGKDPVKCKLDPSVLNPLVAAVGQVDWEAVGTTKPSTRHPDDMIVAVSAGGGLARLEDPRLKPLAAPVSKLLTEATVPPGKLCKPVQSTAG